MTAVGEAPSALASAPSLVSSLPSLRGGRRPPWQSIVSILGAPPLPPRGGGVSRRRGFRPLQRGAAPPHGLPRSLRSLAMTAEGEAPSAPASAPSLVSSLPSLGTAGRRGNPS